VRAALRRGLAHLERSLPPPPRVAIDHGDREIGALADQLTGQAQRNLRQFAEALSRPEMGTLRFAVDGHTDASGPETYNQGLSERRAQAVVEFLKAQGIDPERLQARGFGEEKPAVDDPRDRRNRRVETRLLQ